MEPLGEQPPEDKEVIDELERLQSLKGEIDKKIEDLKETIIKISQQKNTSLLLGTNKLCSVKEYVKVIYPQDKAQLTTIIKAKGLYEQFSTINYFKLGPKIVRGEIDKEILGLVEKEKAFRVYLMDRRY